MNLWKPTMDSMGPVLGYASQTNPYHPNDDRIVRLQMHKHLDKSLEYDVEITMWWRMYEPRN